MRWREWWRKFQGHKRRKKQRSGSTVNKMLSWWRDGGGAASHGPAEAAFLERDTTNGREGCWEGIARLIGRWEGGTAAGVAGLGTLHVP